MLSQTEPQAGSSVPWTPRAAIGVWAAGFFGTAVWLTILVSLYGNNDELPRTVPYLFLGQLALWTAYGIGPLVIARQSEGSLGHWFRFDSTARHVAIAAVIGFLAQVVVIPLVYLPLSRLIDTEEVGEAAEDLIDIAGNRSDQVILFVMIVLIAPIVEELFFRGFALPAIADRLGAPAAIAITSVWFAASHLQLVQFPGLLAIGLILAVCRVVTDSILPPIALHMAFNGVTFGVLVSQLS